MKFERLRLPLYKEFAEIYQVNDFEQLVTLYDIHELMAFMPAHPGEHEITAFNRLMGAHAYSGYMDYQKSNNTFELIMQWQEETGNSGIVERPFQVD